jgi:hypothetical protein
VASPVFKTGVTRPSRVGWVRFPHSPAIACATIAFAITAIASSASAQKVETPVIKPDSPPMCIPIKEDTTARRPPSVVIAGSVEARRPRCRKIPSPRRAFFQSLLLPGYTQLQLQRKKAAGIFITAEATTLGMSVKSHFDLRKAVKARTDSVTIPLVDSVTKVPIIDPETGLQKMETRLRNQNLADRVKARRTHLEDWVAAIVFNHLFAGADAYVAANLADFDMNVSVSPTAGGIRVVARAYW